MSIALIGAGFALDGYSDPVCKHGHARGAESLANFFWRKVGRPQVLKGYQQFASAVENRTGIVFFKDIIDFQGGLGDHIDLWNKTRPYSGEYSTTSSQTWFWELK